VEAGLGGRHDATRVVNARVVGLTNVGLDHQRVLGETRELILAEKVAVLERGAALCVGVVDDALYASAAALAAGAGASCERIDAGAGDDLPLPAAYLRDDGALALRLAELLLAPRPFDRAAAAAVLPASSLSRTTSRSRRCWEHSLRHWTPSSPRPAGTPVTPARCLRRHLPGPRARRASPTS
jgi:folylpolyglutamate synthase/dihydropteroate synthase